MAYDIQEIKESVKNFIIDRFLKNPNNKELTDSTPLISGGIMDSISTMQLVTFLEKKYNFEFQAHEVDRDNLDSIGVIANFVASKIGG
jgi:acyl carrier protein